MPAACGSVELRKIDAIMFEWLLKLARKGEKPVFVSNRQEFLSVWAIAHAWEGLESTTEGGVRIPEAIQAHMDMLMLAFLRGELAFRMSNGYRVLGQSLWATVFGLDKDYDRVSAQLYRKSPEDRDFLDALYVRRSELLHWCEKEFRRPPDIWAPQSIPAQADASPEEPDDNDRWLDQLTDRRKKIVACLEFAKYLWRQDQTKSYEEVFNHPTLVQSGLRSVFSLESFKKWARPIAPDEAKRGGRRPQSDS